VPRNLILAFIATWVIHLGYLGYLVRRTTRVRKSYDPPQDRS